MKRILLFLLFATLVVVSVSCGDNASPTSTAPPQGSKNPMGGDGGGGKAQVPEN